MRCAEICICVRNLVLRWISTPKAKLRGYQGKEVLTSSCDVLINLVISSLPATSNQCKKGGYTYVVVGMGVAKVTRGCCCGGKEEEEELKVNKKEVWVRLKMRRQY